ncbi:DeoR/GlpR family DNA-binding transcription regulator (plasmid) [Alicyclobacillus fastidiosus]|uniref:DeoR/GlpR family DNA-binding transcription regulator n=1 Tax=Alicyclobacillus fastidiosus TaxID=392011 RepID=A0ABY6ZP74_9BACL|nr:DeoR/GlpR family DNA-binding transcription regulator [Alicyclobacillus fastidiosus]WAH44788.1 DeoR/GlpR family DNA-binding transcription regulator [Alicyclobacillus fastidiosus]GMA65743.1 DeoR family transcriptional regulator [Alicyclobacillus fastidiosus]GMA65917.1 DeoR family transcriptional regulator [Alicyclobacillus fastidiosus]
MNERDRRLQDIVAIVEREYSVSVENLQEKLGVSGSTVRADLRLLARQGKIHREHGRVTRVNDYESTSPGGLPSFEKRLQIRQAEKEAITKLAESYVTENDAIILDASSTCYHLAKRLYVSTKALTIVTNGIHSAQLLNQNPRLQVILIGGTLGVQHNTEGILGIELFRNLNIKKCFLSGYGISIEQGVTDFSLPEIEMKRRFIDVAQRAYILTDSTKFGVVSVGKFCDVQQAEAVLTDSQIPESTVREYASHNVQIVRP